MDNLSPAKRALLEKWLQGQQPATEKIIIPPRPQDSPVTISLPQQRHLFLELLERGTAVNNLSVFLQLKGKLNLAALDKSVNQILARHEVLRIRFCVGTGIPAPVILNNCTITIPIVDLQVQDEKNRMNEARRLAEQEVVQPFDLAQGPLLRLKLYQLNNVQYALLLTIHHTVADGWSLGVFLTELMSFYEANHAGTTAHLSSLPVQYYDYAYWQATKKQAEALQASLEYWKARLGGELPVLELPIDRARGAKQTFTGGTYRFVISREVTSALEALGRQEDATLFMTLLTAFYIVLHRYSGQDDILVGTPVANRNLPELEHLIGIFINTLVLRANFSGDPGFRELLRQVRKVSLEAYAHQDFPFEKLVEELKPKRNLNRPPLFQVVFNLQNSPMPKLEIPGLETAFLDIDRGVSQFDMTLMISKLDGQCNAIVEYNADLFNPATIARMFRSYLVFLEFAISNSDSPISTLQLATPEELQHIVYEFNKTQLSFPREQCIHQLVEKQVEKTPDAVAVIYQDAAITYSELNQHANVLARHLRALGVGPEVRVGILMKKSLETIAALLGVLKAGGAYVPIHISSPPERVQFILKDADAHVLLTNINPVPVHEFKGVVVDVNDKNLLSKNDCSNLQPFAKPDNLAYIIYTSGSTGHPKGVMINHYSLVNFLRAMRNKPGMNENDVVLALASISFDISTLELFLPLMTGAKAVVASEEATTNPLLIGEIINRHNINIMQATPATWQLLLQSGWTGNPHLTALCGGDILTRKMADQLLERVGSLWNVYGPTETTVWCMLCKIEKDEAPIAIGRPISNMQVYVLDRYLKPVPVGVIGELHIAGAGLARAYLNSPQLTQEKFIPNPFSSQPGARLYKTGDLARYLPDYSIELLGRMDDQVKVQGNRIELGEITTVFKQHSSVEDGIVITRTDLSGDKRLVAYFVSKPDSFIDSGELREFLRQQLPAYMIPGFFVRMDFLPLTPNGKINRKSLPLPEEFRQVSEYSAPRNEEEQILATIWQHVLNVEQVGVYDNFFDLGGASIQSIQVVAKANMYGYRINAEDIFKYQTIADLAAYIKG